MYLALGLTESRTYSALGQMTRMTKGSLIDLEYRKLKLQWRIWLSSDMLESRLVDDVAADGALCEASACS